MATGVKATEKQLRQLQTNTLTDAEKKLVGAFEKQVKALSRKVDKMDKRLCAVEMVYEKVQKERVERKVRGER